MAIEDGTFTSPEQNKPKRPSYPFITATAQDKYAKVTERDYTVRTNNYFPTAPDRTTVTNLLTYSEQFDNAAWTKTSATVSANSVANPMDGQVTADTLLEAAASAEHTITQPGTIAASAAPFSVCVKGLNRDWARLKITDSAATVFTAFFNLSTGVVGTVSAGATAAITQVYSGWFRCVLIPTAPAAGAATASIQPSTDGSTVSYLGVVTNGLYLFGAQFENGSSASAYASTTNTTRAISAPPTDQSQNSTMDAYADPFSFLCAEQVPATWGDGAYVEFTRPYARIPGQQVNYPGARYFPLPSITNDYGTVSALSTTTYPTITNVGDSFFNVGALAVYTTYNKSIYGSMKVLGPRVVGRASAGTFTLTFGANTTAALNWNDSDATIKAAIDGLASVIAAGLTSTVATDLADASNGGTLTINWSGALTYTPLTMDATGLTVNTSKNPTTQVTSGLIQTIRLPDHYTVTSHGLNTALALVSISTAETASIISTASWGSIDANTIWIPTSGDATYATHAGTYKRAYDPGRSILLRTQETEDFFLPGVSVGITTAADIPIDIGLQNTADFVSALLTLTGWQIYETQGPALWMNGPIYRRVYVAINISDI